MSRGGHPVRRGWCMSCTQPAAITPEEMVAFVDGEASDQVVAHLRGCRRCRSEVERYASAGQRLRRLLGRLDCPSPHRLGEMELELLPPEEAVALAGHVVEC